MIREIELPAFFERELFPAVDLAIDTAVEDMDEALGLTRSVLRQYLQVRRTKQSMRSLPLLVYGAQAGDPKPAIPIAAIHVLWYTAGRYLDNVTDGHVAEASAGLPSDEALMAAVLCLVSVPTEIIARMVLPSGTRDLLALDLARGCSSGMEGQLSEFHARPETVTPESVLGCYRNKTGSGYAMGAAMAARLAGAGPREVELWREFGHVFGSLRQLRNDQEDLASEHGVDLRNQVLTYLFTTLLARTDDPEPLLQLRKEAPESAQAHARLRESLLDPDLLRAYFREVDAVRDHAHRLLDELGGHEPFLGLLREFLDVSARPLPLFQSLL